MTSYKSKGDISPQNLQSHGIYYDAEIYEPSYILPEHVDAVREILLSFKGTLSDNWISTLQREAKEYGSEGLSPEALQPPESALVPTQEYEADLNDRNPEWLAAHTNMKSCAKVAEIARQQEKESEEGWVHFWRSHTFTIASEKARDQPGFHPILDNWSLEGNCLWTEFPNLEPKYTEFSRRTRPKPDLTYAFPMIIPSVEGFRGFERDEFMNIFSRQSLGILVKKGIICTPTAGLRRWMKSPNSTFMSSSDLTCFPWAVVEFKKEVQACSISPEDRCYCQAANASAAALDLRRLLFANIFDDAVSILPPVIAFTCVGHIVKVWLTYLAEPDETGKQMRRMVCIWSTSVRLTWGVATLRAIIVNMHTWASRVLKPRIQACAVQALKNHHASPPQKPAAPDIDLASSTIFDSPRARKQATSRIIPSTTTPTPSLKTGRSPYHLSNSRSGITQQPASPLSLPVSPPKRITATPRIRCQSRTASLAPNHAMSSERRANTSTEPHTMIPETPRMGECTSSKDMHQNVDIDQITKSLQSSHLDDPFVERDAIKRGPTTELGRASEDKKCEYRAYEQGSGLPERTEANLGNASTRRNVDASLQPNQHPVFWHLTGPVPSIFTSLSGSNSPPQNRLDCSGLLSQFQEPKFPFLLKANTPSLAKPHPREALESLSRPAPLLFTSTHHRPQEKNRQKHLSSDPRSVLETHPSQGLQTAVEADAASITRGFATSSPRGSFISQKLCREERTLDKTEFTTFGYRFNLENNAIVRLDTDTTKHVSSADALGSSKHTSSDINTACTEATINTDDDGADPQSNNETSTRAVREDGSDCSDSRCDDRNDRKGGYESDCESESERGRGRQNDKKASSRGYNPRSQTGSEESEESEYDSDQASDSENQTNETSQSARSITEVDLCWLIGLGALSGRQLAQAPYLRVLFLSRERDQQVSMIKDVLEAGAIGGDCYQAFDGDLQDLLTHLNRFVLFGNGITERDFKRDKADQCISRVSSIMASKYITDLDRWHCFRKTLILRSKEACGRLLLSQSFDFSSDEWAELENNAKYATSAHYSPNGIADLIVKNGFPM